MRAWSRRLVAENVLSTGDLIWPMFVCEGRSTRTPSTRCRGSIASASILRLPRREKRRHSAFPPSHSFPTPTPNCAPTTAARPSIPTTSCAAPRALFARPACDVGVLLDVALDPYTSHGHDGLMRGGEIVNDETCRGAGAAGAGAGRGRLRHHRAVRHDGRPRRRHPPGARGGRPSQRADHGLCGEVRLGLLRPVPRCGRLVGDADRRQAHLSDGPGQLATRPCARWRSTSPRAPTW